MSYVGCAMSRLQVIDELAVARPETESQNLRVKNEITFFFSNVFLYFIHDALFDFGNKHLFWTLQPGIGFMPFGNGNSGQPIHYWRLDAETSFAGHVYVPSLLGHECGMNRSRLCLFTFASKCKLRKSHICMMS